jgi:hypothetical protein
MKRKKPDTPVSDDIRYTKRQHKNCFPEDQISSSSSDEEEEEAEDEQPDEASEAEEEDTPTTKETKKGDKKGNAAPPEPSYVSLEHAKIDDEEYCWGCETRFGMSQLKGKLASLDKLWKAFERNQDLRIEKLAELLCKAHQKFIYNDRIGEVEPWPPDVILQHLKVHMINPKLQFDAMVKDTNVLVNNLRNACLKRNAKGNYIVPDKTNTELFLKANKHLSSLLKEQAKFNSSSN